MYIDDTSGLSITELYTKARRLVRGAWRKTHRYISVSAGDQCIKAGYSYFISKATKINDSCTVQYHGEAFEMLQYF